MIHDLSAGKKGFVYSARFSLDGQQLAVSAGPLIELWDVETGELITSLEGHTSAVYQLEFLPDRRRLASSSHGAGESDGVIKVWDYAKRQCLRDLDPDMRTAMAG